MAFTGTLAAFEASVLAPTVDATAPTVDQTTPTADALNAGDTSAFVGTVAATVLAGTLAATEAADAATFAGQAEGTVAPPVFVGGGGYHPPPRPFPVTGYGFGILPPLWGEAHGTVGMPAAGEWPDDVELALLLMLAA
jgi:hypothetical protein